MQRVLDLFGSYEVTAMSRRGLVSSRVPFLCRCERWFGVCFSLALVLLCFVSAVARAWVPMLGRVGHGETGAERAASVALGIGAGAGIVSGTLALISFARVCAVHPGRVWYDVHPAPPPTAAAATVDGNGADEGSTEALVSRGDLTGERWRHCGRCDRPKPPCVHHCSRCGTCVDRMDHHCPWIGQCVGRGNHKFFLLFLLWTAVGGTCVVGTTLPNFVGFMSEVADDRGGKHNHPVVPPPPPPVGSRLGVTSAAPGPPASAAPAASEPDLLLAIVWMIAALFALMLGCFFGAVCQGVMEGETQLDRNKSHVGGVGLDGRPMSKATSRDLMRRHVMGEGSQWLWALPTDPKFSPDALRVVRVEPAEEV